MSDMVTHWASFDDCRRIAQLDDQIDPSFRQALAKSPDIGRLGTITTGGNTWMPGILTKARERMRTGAWTSKDERNVSFVLGCIIHQACDFAMKPLLSRTSGHDWNTMQATMAKGVASKASQSATQDVSAYYDAEVFRRVYLDGNDETLNRFFMAESTPDGAAFEQFVRASFQRALLASHTLKPDLDNMERWLDNLVERVQPLYLDVDLWVRVFNHPDPAKIDAYGVLTEFYRTDDPAICAARMLQRGEQPGPDLRAAVFKARAYTCAYGEVLQVGLDYLRNATRFWQGMTDVLASPNDLQQKKALEVAKSVSPG